MVDWTKYNPNEAVTKHYLGKAVKYQQEYNLEKTTPLGHNDETDAFRHAFMQGDFTWRSRGLGDNTGYKLAKFIGDDHESDKHKSPKMTKEQWAKEKNMDLWNNEVGRKTALEIKNKTVNKNLSQKQFEDLLAKELAQKIKDGELITNPNDKRVFKDAESFSKQWQKYYEKFKKSNTPTKNTGLSNSDDVADKLVTPKPDPTQVAYPNYPTPGAVDTGAILGAMIGDSIMALLGAIVGGVAGGGGSGSATGSSSNAYANGAWDSSTGQSFKFHTGGVVPGNGEVMSVLMGGETVRTKAQEDDLQQQLVKNHIENYAPMVCGENAQGNSNEQKQSASSQQSKPIHQQLTKDDEIYILNLVVDALARNRMGLRNQIKAL